MTDKTIPQAELDDWLDAIARLHASTPWDHGDWKAAEHAVASLLSEFGYLNAPLPVLRMFAQAIEVGYMTALQDVRGGSFDTEIAMWRPGL